MKYEIPIKSTPEEDKDFATMIEMVPLSSAVWACLASLFIGIVLKDMTRSINEM